MTLITGSLWAKYRWGHWWLWSEKQLVLFLVLFLFYSAYFMLRFSVEPGPQRANLCAVYAIFGVILIPISFLAIRLANQYIHPVAFNRHGPQMAGSQFFTFCVCLAAMLALFVALYQFELLGKRLDAKLRELRELLDMSTEEKYVAAAYLVVFAFVLVYLVIMALKLSRLDREIGELTELARKKAE